MKPGRPRRQEGQLIQRGGSWLGRWRVNTSSGRERVTISLGLCEEISKIQAKAKMRQLIAKTNTEAHALATIGLASTVPQLSRIDKLTMHKAGAISELLVCADLMSKGWDVYRATDPTCACDLMAVRPGIAPVRVEVKTGKPEAGRLLRLHSKVGKFDVLALVDGSSLRYYAYHQLGNLKNPSLSKTIGTLDEVLQVSDTPRSGDSENSEIIGDLSEVLQ